MRAASELTAKEIIRGGGGEGGESGLCPLLVFELPYPPAPEKSRIADPGSGAFLIPGSGMGKQ